MENRTFTVYEDPGHAWVEVPLTLLDELGISDKITSYSYVKGDMSYLEEDCDMTTFVEALKVRGITPTFRTIHEENGSKIRDYYSYSVRQFFTQN